VEKQTYTPDNSIIRLGESVRHIVKAGQVFGSLTPLMRDADKKLIVWDGSDDKAVFLSQVQAINLAADTKLAVLASGTYRIDAIQWPNGLTDAQKRAAFDHAGINVDD
jgi:hypothetical protein